MLGRFITFEGVEGSGKTTQIERLARVLQEQGHDPLVTCEPGGTDLGQHLRGLILGLDFRPEPLTELFMLLADRAQHVVEVIRPALAAGRVVLCDRFTDATLAYQVVGRELDRSLATAAAAAAAGNLQPDLTLLLDLPIEAGWQRVVARGGADRLDQEDAAFHRRVRDAYHQQRQAEPARIKLVDASTDPDTIHRCVLAEVMALLERAG